MKRIIGVVVFFMAIATIVIVASFLITGGFDDPEVGEVWRWTPKGSNNPFVKGQLRPYYDYEVLAVKNGYVQYLDLADSSVDSSTERMFKVGAEHISGRK